MSGEEKNNLKKKRESPGLVEKCMGYVLEVPACMEKSEVENPYARKLIHC